MSSEVKAFPDWKESSEYPKCFEEWGVFKWVWEFLRRNPDYQSDFAHFSSIPAYTDDGKTGKLSGTSLATWEPMEYRYCNPDSLPGELGADYIARMEAAGIEYEEEPLEEYLSAKWRILYLIDPLNPNAWIEKDAQVCLLIPSDGRFAGLPEEVFDNSPDRFGEVTMRFDLRYPIDRQIEFSKQLLMQRLEQIEEECSLRGKKFDKRFAPKTHKNKLPEYLRAYDAFSSGARTAEVAEVLYPHLDRMLTRDPGITKAENAIKVGRSLVEGGYYDMMRWA